ncbi:MAG TPA: hypothetical protein DCO83_09385 [Mucilaginibacter sp.]|nr:hypothetical protein [Mucilaginibacter sp.]
MQISSKFAIFDKIQRRPVFNRQGAQQKFSCKIFSPQKIHFSSFFLSFFEILFSIVLVYSALNKTWAVFTLQAKCV